MIPPPPTSIPPPPPRIPPPPPNTLAPPPPPRERPGAASEEPAVNPYDDGASYADPAPKRKRIDTYYDGHNESHLAELAKKDELTLMVRSLHPRTGEFDLFELFSEMGKVTDVKMITDERSGKSLGVAYVQMADVTGASAALALTGRPLKGQPILVQRSLAEKNRLASQGASSSEINRLNGNAVVQTHLAMAQQDASHGPTATALAEASKKLGIKVYVGGLDFAFDETQIEQIFSKFGTLNAVHLQRDHVSGMSKGFAFIHFNDSSDGQRCCEEMDGANLAGRAIRVNISGTQHAPPANNPPQLNAAAAAAAGFMAPLTLGVAGGGNDYGTVTNLDGLDTDGKAGGEKMNQSQRANLLMKLASSANMEVPDATRKVAAQTSNFALTGQVGAADLGGSDSRCVVLKNMFDRLAEEVESNPNFFEELANDVRGECTRLGTVLFCQADKWSNGFVYIKMLANAEAARVLELMHGRYFAKNKILASHTSEEALDKKFKLRRA